MGSDEQLTAGKAGAFSVVPTDVAVAVAITAAPRWLSERIRRTTNS